MLAVILAGDTEKNHFQLAGRPMVWHVAKALGQCRSIRQVCVLAPPDDWFDLSLPPDVMKAPCGKSLFETIGLALEQGKDEEKMLIVTADIPLLTTEAVEHFLALCLENPADLHYPIIEKNRLLKAYPSCKRTFVRLLDGTFTGGNIFLISPKIVQEVYKKSEDYFTYRKKPWRLCKLLGWSFLVKMTLGRLKIAEIEQRVWDVFHIVPKSVIIPHAEIGFDVDKPHDLALIRPYMSLKL